MRKFKSFFHTHLVSLIILLVIALWFGRPFLSSTLVNGHDTEVHGVHLANYYLALKQGQLPPQWAPNMNHGFGYPVFIYSYHLPYILGLVPYALTNSVEIGMNFTYLVALLAAIFGIYFLVWSLSDRKVGVLASLVFVLSPYYLFDLYIRGSISDLLFISFLPWVLFFLSKPKKLSAFDHLGLMLSLVAMMLSHQSAYLVGLPLLLSWVWLRMKIDKSERSVVVSKVIPIIFSLLITAFYWLPAIAEVNLIEVAGSSHSSTQSGFINLKNIFWSLWDCADFCYTGQARPLPTFAGPVVLFLLSLSAYVLWFSKNKKLKQEDRLELVFWLSIAVVTFILMSPISLVVWKNLPLAGMIEFPWQLLWLPTLSAAMSLAILSKSYSYASKIGMVVISLIVGQSLFGLVMWKVPQSRFSKSLIDWLHFGEITSNYEGVLPKTFDSHKSLKLDDRVIVRAVGEMIFPDIRQEEPNSYGQSDISFWSGTEMRYVVNAPQTGYAVQRTMYFPGWRAKVNGEETDIFYTDEEFPGRILLPIEAGESQIEAYYEGKTWPRQLAKVLFVVGVAGAGVYFVKLFYL